MNIVLITGLSGAGKTVAVHAFEDMGYYCVDNLPPQLLPKFIELCEQSNRLDRVAVVVDIRGGHFFDQLEKYLTDLVHPVQILFLEAGVETLVRRFKESRRNHPLNPEGSIQQGIEQEIKRLTPLRGRADFIVDTGETMAADLRKELFLLFEKKNGKRQLKITVVSFGFRYGLPMDADLVFDLRFLPNPHYQESLQDLTGRQQEVRDYVLGWTITHQFLKKLHDLLGFLVPCYIEEGKTQLIVAVGCTGGKHRSVTIAHTLCAFFEEQGQQVTVLHRDIEKG
jgi:UPF0042 nucleotide-binding protein